MNVIIVLFNSKDVITRCLNALNDAACIADKQCKVYCVDNQPDALWPNLEFEDNFSHLNVFPICADDNSGFSGGCKIAIDTYGINSEVLLLNPDAFVSHDFFLRLMPDIQKFHYVANLLVGTTAVSEVEDIATRNAGKMPEAYTFRNHSVISPDSVFEDMRVWPLAACLYIKTDLRLSDLFEMPFFLTMEEPVLVKKMAAIVYFSGATVVHEGGHSYASRVNEFEFHVESLSQYRNLFSFSFPERVKLFMSVLKLKLLIKINKLFQRI